MCLATSIINSYVDKGISDEEISSVMEEVTYDYGIAECYKKGDDSQKIAHYMLIKNTGELINPGCDSSEDHYAIFDIKPLQQCRL